MKLNFTHPHSCDSFEADVAPECKGSTAIDGLIDNKFLNPPEPGHGYDLSLPRTKSQIGANATLGSCGVQEGDVINVLHRGIGA